MMLQVIIVDDDRNVSQCLRKLIPWNELGYEVIGECYDGLQAYNMAVEKNPDIIISDIKMPIMSGTELCKKIRETIDDVSIIFLSAYEDFQTAQIALKYNITEYILKPITMKKIDMLYDILKELAINYKNRDYFNNILRNNQKEREILENLKKSNIQYFIKFFDEFTNCIAGNFDVIREACFKIIKILYDYLEFMGFNGDMIESKRDSIYKELMNLKKKRDMVTYVSKMYFDVLQFRLDEKDDYYHVLMDRIKDYINSNYSDTMFSVSQVADKFNFSPDYIGKLFKQYTGITISNYIADVRLVHATELLRASDIPINDIADVVGYASPNYFAKVFKAKQNITPSEYRMKIRLISKDVL